VFEGLGSLEELYSIKLKPHALFIARNVILPLQKKLAAMEKQEAIFPVTKPTPCCVGMVAVP